MISVFFSPFDAYVAVKNLPMRSDKPSPFVCSLNGEEEEINVFLNESES